MSDENVTDSQEEEAQPQEGTESETAQDATGDSQEEKPNRDWEAEAKSNAKESQKLRKDRKDLEKRLEALEAEKLSDEEKQAKELSDLKAEKTQWEADRRTQAVRDSVESLAAKFKISDSRMAANLIKPDSIEFDEGKPQNMETVVEALIAEYPSLVGAAPKPQGSINAGSGQTSAPNVTLDEKSLTAAQNSDMSVEKYAQFKDHMEKNGSMDLDTYMKLSKAAN